MDKKYFAVMIQKQERNEFRLVGTQEEARAMADNYACMGLEVTVFDYDEESDCYFEFYKV